jgi:nicotinic acid phosphoribosyltransferase
MNEYHQVCVTVVEQQCSLQTKNLCIIVSTGNVFNTKLLDYKARHEYKFDVSAEDCGGVKSNDVQVKIHVKAICFVSWTGWLFTFIILFIIILFITNMLSQRLL